MKTMRLWAMVMAVVLSAACRGSDPTAPDPTPPPTPPPVVVAPPTLACPAAVTATTTGTGATVSYTTPTAEGGQSPVTVACEPASGVSFAIGSSEVRCTATDGLNRTATCTFGVTVSRTPTISKTKFLAFGDSITVGTVSSDNPSPPPPYLLRDIADSYPSVLRQLLAARYSTQTITMINEGKGGEKAVDGVGRAQTVFNANRPEVALIMDGYNDLSTLGEAGIDAAIAAVNDMVKDARFRGARVFLATLTPPPVNVNRGISNSTIVRYNEKLRAMAKGENAVLVDVYAAFAPDPNRYNSADGRHPNEAGYRKIAETFFAAIQAELEVR
jgi:lysophospholipase L1-like esterase